MAGLLSRWRSNMSSGTFRFLINCWGPFVGAGISITKITSDYRQIDVRMKQHWYNTNYVGTHFGGSIYAMTDAFYMLILLRNLGHEYIVWDKAASIDFKKPGRGTLHASFTFSVEEIDAVRANANSMGKYVFDKPVDITNDQGEVVASVIKTLYVRHKPQDVSKGQITS